MGKKNNKQVGKTVLSRAKRKSITKASQAKSSTATKAAPKECRDAAASEDLDGLLGKDYTPPLPQPVADALQRSQICFLATAGHSLEPHLSLMRFTYCRGLDGKVDEVMSPEGLAGNSTLRALNLKQLARTSGSDLAPTCIQSDQISVPDDLSTTRLTQLHPRGLNQSQAAGDDRRRPQVLGRWREHAFCAAREQPLRQQQGHRGAHVEQHRKA